MMVFEHDYKKFPELTNAQLQTMGLSSPHEQITASFDAEVVEVHDGDTITVRTDFRDFDFPIRFHDIDTKELNEGGEEAGDWLRAKILGQKVRVIIDPENRVGKYGRLLGRVLYIGMVLGQEQIYLGLALPFGRKNEGQPNSLTKNFSMQQWFK